MADQIKDVLEEGLQLVESKWEKKRSEDKKAFDEKVVEITKAYQADLAKQKEEMTKAQSEEMAKMAMDLEEKYKAKSNKPKNPQIFMKDALDSDEGLNFIKAAKAAKAHTFNLKSFDFADFTGNEEFRTSYRDPILNKYEDFHYRDVLPRGTMDGGFVKYPKEVATVGAAEGWLTESPAVAKPEVEPKFETYQADAIWIAGLIKEVPVEMFEDLSWTSSFLSMKGMNELMLAEDLAIQNGSQTLSGILQNAVGYAGSETGLLRRIVDAMLVQLANNHHTANGIVLSNEAYSEIVLNTASGSGEFDLPNVVTVDANGTMRILGRPVYSNSYLDPAGVGAIVADWREAQLLDRHERRFRIFEQNNDDAEKNVVLVRFEERIALPIFYDNAFVQINATS